MHLKTICSDKYFCRVRCRISLGLLAKGCYSISRAFGIISKVHPVSQRRYRSLITMEVGPTAFELRIKGTTWQPAAICLNPESFILKELVIFFRMQQAWQQRSRSLATKYNNTATTIYNYITITFGLEPAPPRGAEESSKIATGY